MFADIMASRMMLLCENLKQMIECEIKWEMYEKCVSCVRAAPSYVLKSVCQNVDLYDGCVKYDMLLGVCK